MRHRPGTFSIAVRDREMNTFGAAVATGTVAVGAMCPHVSANAAVLTQAFTRTDHGREAIDREHEFAFTGEECVEWCGSRVGEDYTVAGNILAGPDVVDAVVSTANVIEVNVNMAESEDDFPTFA